METNATADWLKSSLSADSLLTAIVADRIYNTIRAKGSALPAVVFQLQVPGNDFMVLGGYRVWTPNLWLVRGIAEQDSFAGDLVTIANRIDAVLHRGSGSNAEGTIFTCVRKRPYQWVEVVNGVQFPHLGGFYEIRAR